MTAVTHPSTGPLQVQNQAAQNLVQDLGTAAAAPEETMETEPQPDIIPSVDAPLVLPKSKKNVTFVGKVTLKLHGFVCFMFFEFWETFKLCASFFLIIEVTKFGNLPCEKVPTESH